MFSDYIQQIAKKKWLAPLRFKVSLGELLVNILTAGEEHGSC